MPSPKILIVDDDRLIRWSLSQKLGRWGYEVFGADSGELGLRLASEETPDLILLDMKLPDAKGTDILEDLKKHWPELPVVMITAFGVIEDAVTAMRLGAYDFVTKPVDDAKLQSVILHALETVSLKKKIAAFREMEKRQLVPGQIVGQTPVMHKLLDMVQKIALSETSIVLLQGESGTGKDLIAQNIHLWSRRSEAPFLAINCSAIPGSLLESELFGYEKGAFTDAKQQKRGLIELADEGTLFLDEIGSLDLSLQAKLLRFLETSTFKRVGGLRDVQVDLLVIVATNQDLAGLCEEGKFRRDLFFRLNVCPVNLPRLAERREDILPLARHFIAHYREKFNKNIEGLSKEAEALLLNYPWPGNIRELKNAVERAMIFEEGSVISEKYLPIDLSRVGLDSPGASPTYPAGEGLSLLEAERRLVVQALEKTLGNQSRAARMLGIGRDALRYKIKKLGLDLKKKNFQMNFKSE
jgi:two-component system response regulator AtoC